VRAYEDRSDLLRSLIIGPEHTPYQDAPFVIDWYLAPDFPQSPPKAHFHSWTQGNGRGERFLTELVRAHADAFLPSESVCLLIRMLTTFLSIG
jgi:hypothetical protein